VNFYGFKRRTSFVYDGQAGSENYSVDVEAEKKRQGGGEFLVSENIGA